MRKSTRMMRLCLAGCALFLTGCLSVASTGSTGEVSLPRLVSGHVDYVAPDGTRYRTVLDVAGYATVGELMAAADLVALGKVVARTPAAVNLERDPADPSRAHPTQQTLADRLTFEVERYYKGKDGRQISLLQVSQMSVAGGLALVADTTQRPYQVGEHYFVFLKRGAAGQGYGPVGEPSHFLVTDGQVVVQSTFAGPQQWFAPQPLAEFTAAIKAEKKFLRR